MTATPSPASSIIVLEAYEYVHRNHQPNMRRREV